VGKENALAVKAKEAERAAERSRDSKVAEGFLEDEKAGLIVDLEKERQRRRECEKLAAEYRTQIAARELNRGTAAKAASARVQGAEIRADLERRKLEEAAETGGHVEKSATPRREPFRYSFFDHAQDRSAKQPGIAFGTTKTYLTRTNDQNAVREAMRIGLDREFADIEREYGERKRMAQERKASMTFHDVEKGSAEAEISEAQLRNAEMLKLQMVEKQKSRAARLAEQRKEVHGYFGPDEKVKKSPLEQAHYRQELLAQMETDKQRRLDRETERITLEQQLTANGTKEAEATHEDSGAKKREKARRLKHTLEKQMLMQRLSAAVGKM
jgi:hypothetical protein